MQVQAPKYNGDPTIASLANGLGTLGRYGDSYMVHAAEGETVVPAEILAANPQLRDQLFWQMRMMGIADPNRYVVGNNLNSINPITGQPEFFFKKIFKAVKKIFKKALPVIAPIVGNLILPGIGGPLASALVTKLQGGSWGDVLKSAAFSYAGSALGQGVMGALQPGAAGGVSGFTQGLGKGIMAPFQAAGNLFAGTGAPFLGGSMPAAANPLSQGILGQGGAGMFFQSTAGAPTTYDYGRSGLFPKYNPVTNIPVPPPPYQVGYGANQLQTQTPWKQQAPKGLFSGTAGPSGTDLTGGQMYQVGGGNIIAKSYEGEPVNLNQSQLSQLQATNNVYQTESGNYILTPDYEAALQPGAAGADIIQQGQTQQLTGRTWPDASGQLWQENPLGGAPIKLETPAPSIFSREGAKQAAGTAFKTLAAPIALGTAAYFMAEDPDELSPDELAQLSDPQRSAYDQYTARGRQKDATGLALLVEAGISPTQDASTLSANWGIPQEDAQDFLNSFYGAAPATTATAARGGIVGLQGGGEIMGAGTGTSDSIPARLSDGEFVMTADAVRGMGNGSRDLGAARMYDLMSRFERTA